MALQTSGAISISQIRTELGSSSGSLRTLSSLAGKSTPDAMSEFYGYSALTQRFAHVTGATSVGGQTGDGSGDKITFVDATLGDGNSAYSVWQMTGFTNGAICVFQWNGGSSMSELKIYQGTSSSGPWTLRGTAVPSYPGSAVQRVIYTTNGAYLRLEIDKQDGGETLYSANLAVYQS